MSDSKENKEYKFHTLADFCKVFEKKGSQQGIDAAIEWIDAEVSKKLRQYKETGIDIMHVESAQVMLDDAIQLLNRYRELSKNEKKVN